MGCVRVRVRLSCRIQLKNKCAILHATSDITWSGGGGDDDDCSNSLFFIWWNWIIHFFSRWDSAPMAMSSRMSSARVDDQPDCAMDWQFLCKSSPVSWWWWWRRWRHVKKPHVKCPISFTSNLCQLKSNIQFISVIRFVCRWADSSTLSHAHSLSMRQVLRMRCRSYRSSQILSFMEVKQVKPSRWYIVTHNFTDQLVVGMPILDTH